MIVMYLRILFLLSCSTIAAASPWFTGPLLAPSGKTIPAKHVNFEPYAFYTIYPQQFKSLEVTPILTAGLTDFLDLQMAFPYDASWDKHQHGSGIGDYSLGFGLQLLRQDKGWFSDLRFVVQEVFPTGHFNNLDPAHLGTDQTGSGAYQTVFGFNFQRLIELQNQHYLRTRLSLVAATASDVKVHGVSTFGGNPSTVGKVRPGNSYSTDLAFEYTLTQHWVPVFEMLYVNSGSSGFSGSPGFTPGGTIDSIGGAGGNQLSLAPAIEYSFNANIGLIAGVWFSVTGPHSSRFVSNVIALNCFF